VIRAAVLLFIAATAWAQVAVPPLTGRVTDLTGTLTREQQAGLERMLQEFEARKGTQLAVLIVPTTKPEPIEQFALRVGEQWKIGRKKVDDGAILVVAKNDRAVRIEVGYGLEGELTDAQSRTIIETRILPRFRQGDFAAGIKAGVAAMIETLGGSYDPALPQVQVRDSERAPSPFPLAIALPIIMMIFLNRLFSPRRRQRRRRGRGYGGPIVVPGGWGGGRGGFGGGARGGGFGGGGGSFGGGGASGRW
jgi:uncharacterized protein